MTTAQCLSQLPLHAEMGATTNTECSWKCNAGYYHTVNTCRQCTYNSETCAVGWYLQPCTNTSDALCRQCPSLAGEQVVYISSLSHVTEDDFNQKCQNSRGCQDGFALVNASACAPCPSGFFCVQGEIPQTCPDPCTVPHEGASSVLACMGQEVTGASVSALLFLGANTPNQTNCPALDTYLAARAYGTFWGGGISFVMTAINRNIGTFTCEYSAPTCVMPSYIQWLSTFMDDHKDEIDARLRACLQQGSELVVGRMLAQITGVLTNNNTVASGWWDKTKQRAQFQKNEILQYTQEAWAQNKKTIADTTGLMIAGSLALSMLLLCVTGIWIAKIKRKTIVAHLYQRLRHWYSRYIARGR